MLQSKAGYIDARPLTASSAKPLATHGRTIHRGQIRKSGRATGQSGLHLKNRHRQPGLSGPKSATSGSDQPYSITSSARASSVGGTVIPIERAVFRFMDSLIRVGS